MTTEEYQKHVKDLDIHPDKNKLFAHALGLCEEAGEFAGKLCKAHRKGVYADAGDLMAELGDVFWRLTAISNCLGVNIESVMEANYLKLTDRKKRDVIIGEGDNR